MTSTLQQQLVLEELSVPGFHRVVRVRDAKSGLDAIIAIHDLRLAKVSLGGTRIHAYETFEDAFWDAFVYCF